MKFTKLEITDPNSKYLLYFKYFNTKQNNVLYTDIKWSYNM